MVGGGEVMVLLLLQVSGERSQEEVFRDVQRAHAKIIRPQPHPPPSRASVGRYNNQDDFYTRARCGRFYNSREKYRMMSEDHYNNHFLSVMGSLIDILLLSNFDRDKSVGRSDPCML